MKETKKYIGLALAGAVFVWAVVAGLVFLVSFKARLDTDLTLSLAQVVLEAVLVPITLVGFTLAFIEFRHSREEPILDLRLQQNNGTLGEAFSPIRPVKGGAISNQVEFFVTNTGNAVEPWWLLRIDIPVTEFKDQVYSHTFFQVHCQKEAHGKRLVIEVNTL